MTLTLETHLGSTDILIILSLLIMNIRCLPPAFLNNEYYALFSTLHFLFYLMVYPRVTSW